MVLPTAVEEIGSQAALGRPSGTDGGGVVRALQIILRGSPAIRPAAVAPIKGPSTTLTPIVPASIAPSVQPA